MFRFFRQLRQRLLTENKLSRYLFYAIGEIILVVIGILLALQIDSWRQDQINLSLRKSYIASFKRDLAADTLLLQGLNGQMQRDIEYHLHLIQRISSPLATKDTLVQIIRKEYSPYFNPSNAFNTATFERMNANGHLELLDSTLSVEILKHRNRLWACWIKTYRPCSIPLKAVCKYFQTCRTPLPMGTPCFRERWANWRSDSGEQAMKASFLQP